MKTETETDAKEWTITDLRADLGHDTMQSEDGANYHNYFCAVVLKTDDESMNLIYENALPENLDLKVGDRYHIDGLDTATYSESWRGFWLHDVKLSLIDQQ